MSTQISVIKRRYDRRIAVLVFFIMLTVYVTTAEGYLSGDPKLAFKVTMTIKNQEDIPGFELGETRTAGSSPIYPLCYNGMLCSIKPTANSVMFLPFVIIQDLFHPIPDDVFWHNGPPERTLTGLFYGPIIMSFLVAIVFLILRQLEFKVSTSLVVTFLYGFASTAWPLSQKAFNVAPETLFLLGGILFLIKFFKNNSNLSILVSGIFFSIALHTRIDALLIIGIIMLFLFWKKISKKIELKKVLIFIIPIVAAIAIFGIINYIKFNSFVEFGYGDYGRADLFLYPLHLGLYGQLFSPGYGLIVYCPLVITTIFSFRDFFKKNSEFTILFLLFFLSFLFLYASKEFWSGGLGSWGPRYLFPVTVFLIIPLAASIEKRSGLLFRSFLFITSSLGFFMSLLILPIFTTIIWNYQLGGYGSFKITPGLPPPIFINNPIYSNFANTIKFQSNFFPDILLLQAFGEIIIVYTMIILIVLGILLIKLLKNYQRKMAVSYEL